MTDTLVEIAAGEVLEETLDDLGLPWRRRESGWVILAARHRPREVIVATLEQRLRIEAELCSWDNLDQTALQALSLVLAQAGATLPHAQFKIDGTRAIVFAEVSCSHLEAQLRGALAAVLVGSRALAREAVAVLSADLATQVVRFFAAEERFSATERI